MYLSAASTPSIVSMPRRSISLATLTFLSCELLLAALLFASGAFSPSSSSTSSSFALTFIIPARRLNTPSGDLEMTVALTPMDFIFTTSPTFTGRADTLSASSSMSSFCKACSERLSWRRNWARASFTRCAS